MKGAVSAAREKKLAEEKKVVKKYNINQNKARLSANEVSIHSPICTCTGTTMRRKFEPISCLTVESVLNLAARNTTTSVVNSAANDGRDDQRHRDVKT